MKEVRASEQRNVDDKACIRTRVRATNNRQDMPPSALHGMGACPPLLAVPSPRRASAREQNDHDLLHLHRGTHVAGDTTPIAPF